MCYNELCMQCKICGKLEMIIQYFHHMPARNSQVQDLFMWLNFLDFLNEIQVTQEDLI